MGWLMYVYGFAHVYLSWLMYVYELVDIFIWAAMFPERPAS
jgi:hypothetical protein